MPRRTMVTDAPGDDEAPKVVPKAPPADVCILPGVDPISPPPEHLGAEGREIYFEWARKVLEAGGTPLWLEARYEVEALAIARQSMHDASRQGKLRAAMHGHFMKAIERLEKRLGIAREEAGRRPAAAENPFATSGFSARHRKA